DDLGLVELGQLDQLHVHLADGGEVVFHDLDRERGDFLDALQNVEPAAAAVALERVGRVGHELQFAQHELRDDDDPVEEAGFGDVGDAAVDDDAGVEDLVALLGLLLAAEDTAQGGEVQQVALVRPHDQSNVGHEQHDEHLQEALRVSRLDAVLDDQADLKQHDDHADGGAGSGVGQGIKAKGVKDVGGGGENSNENKTNEQQFHKAGTSPFRSTPRFARRIMNTLAQRCALRGADLHVGGPKPRFTSSNRATAVNRGANR